VRKQVYKFVKIRKKLRIRHPWFEDSSLSISLVCAVSIAYYYLWKPARLHTLHIRLGCTMYIGCVVVRKYRILVVFCMVSAISKE